MTLALDAVAALIERSIGERLFVLGLCGAQGSGKSTLAKALKARFDAAGVPTAILSIDDLYLTKAARAELAHTVHPLFATRGVPGTHDVALGLDVITALERGERAALPRFDKATDDRLPPDRWDRAPAGTGLLILEGWCVGARPQSEEALADPVNALERDEDGEGIWRRYANAALAGAYQRLFDRIDRLAMLMAPSFDVVPGWRREQERDLPSGGMSDDAIARFVQLYERMTRHMLVEMPGRADLTIALDADRRVRSVS